MDADNQTAEPSFECILFGYVYLKNLRLLPITSHIADLDETLYPLISGLSAATTESINKFMIEKLHIEESKVQDLCVPLYKQYGTTMAGLRALGYKFDYAEYHNFVLGRLPYENLKTDLLLRNILQSLPLRKLIFTNADAAHTERVLKRLGISDCFEGIICFETLNDNSKGTEEVKVEEKISPVICKPFEGAFKAAFQIANVDPRKTVFVDDNLRNIQTGKNLGLHTIWIGSSQRVEGVDQALESIHNIREALPQLWDGNSIMESINHEAVSIETTVIA